MKDIEIVGHQFTGERGRNTDHWVEIRLDRGLANESWLQTFPLAKLYNTEGSPSDHSLIFLEPKSTEIRLRRRRFRFENAWLTEPLCFQLVKDSWEASCEFNITQKVKSRGEQLDVWEREITGCFRKRIRECKAQLKQLRSCQDAVSVFKYADVRQQLYMILDKNEIFWRRRSKQLWLESGDKNIKYFHASSSTRRRRNQIHKLKSVDGDSKTWQDGLPNLIEDFFQKLFTSDQM